MTSRIEAKLLKDVTYEQFKEFLDSLDEERKTWSLDLQGHFKTDKEFYEVKKEFAAIVCVDEETTVCVPDTVKFPVTIRLPANVASSSLSAVKNVALLESEIPVLNIFLVGFVIAMSYPIISNTGNSNPNLTSSSKAAISSFASSTNCLPLRVTPPGI